VNAKHQVKSPKEGYRIGSPAGVGILHREARKDQQGDANQEQYVLQPVMYVPALDVAFKVLSPSHGSHLPLSW